MHNYSLIIKWNSHENNHPVFCSPEHVSQVPQRWIHAHFISLNFVKLLNMSYLKNIGFRNIPKSIYWIWI